MHDVTADEETQAATKRHAHVGGAQQPATRACCVATCAIGGISALPLIAAIGGIHRFLRRSAAAPQKLGHQTQALCPSLRDGRFLRRSSSHICCKARKGLNDERAKSGAQHVEAVGGIAVRAADVVVTLLKRAGVRPGSSLLTECTAQERSRVQVRLYKQGYALGCELRQQRAKVWNERGQHSTRN